MLTWLYDICWFCRRICIGCRAFWTICCIHGLVENQNSCRVWTNPWFHPVVLHLPILITTRTRFGGWVQTFLYETLFYPWCLSLPLTVISPYHLTTPQTYWKFYPHFKRISGVRKQIIDYTSAASILANACPN